MRVRTTVAPSPGAKSYSFSIHQSVSLRASHVETRRGSRSAGISVPVCCIDTTSGAPPRVICSHGVVSAGLINIMYAMGGLWFESALLPSGWARDVRLTGADGRIESVVGGVAPESADERHGIALPGLANLHSHAFQRGLAGLTERRGAGGDSFWTWREIMYRFLERVGPEELEALAALAFAEMLEAGFTRVGEFHYLHHDRNGSPYANPGELAARLAAAASRTGIALTLLPALYAHGGFGGAPPGERQKRFLNDPERFARIVERSRALANTLAGGNVGVAAHSLRAVTPSELSAAVQLAGSGVIHIHIAEQTREVEECRAWCGRRPVEWLLENCPV